MLDIEEMSKCQLRAAKKTFAYLLHRPVTMTFVRGDQRRALSCPLLSILFRPATRHAAVVITIRLLRLSCPTVYLPVT